MPKITYTVETHGEKPLMCGIFKTLGDAKLLAAHLVETRAHKEFVVTKLNGPYFGEGWHVYKMLVNSNGCRYIYKR